MTEIFVFNNPEDCLESAMRPTEYEQKKGIVAKKARIIYDNPEFKIAEIEKTDNSVTLVVLIKKAKNKDLWINWIPTKNQFNVLSKLPGVIKRIEKENLDKRTFQL